MPSTPFSGVRNSWLSVASCSGVIPAEEGRLVMARDCSARDLTPGVREGVLATCPDSGCGDRLPPTDRFAVVFPEGGRALRPLRGGQTAKRSGGARVSFREASSLV